MPKPPAAVVVLAAGAGTRMKSARPKVLHEIAGAALIDHVLAAAAPLNAGRTVVVVGHGREQVQEHLAGLDFAVQAEQLGTGHAVQIALPALPAEGLLLVLNGDTPLLSTADLQDLLVRVEGHAAIVMTAELPNPTGYGRILRDSAGAVLGIVEERDATAEQKAITEVNSGVYVFDLAELAKVLGGLGNKNSQGEIYLTDAIAALRERGLSVTAHLAAAENMLGVNSRADLAAVGAQMRDRLVAHWQSEGVTFIDPDSVWLDSSVTLAADVTVQPNVQLHGNTQIETGAIVGPDCTLTDTQVGPGAQIYRTVAIGAKLGPKAQAGPFTFLRPGTVLGAGARAGGFVEIKNANIGTDSKVPHLSYVGDATIGERTNIGAATVFVNYDGVEKHHTTVGDDVRIGSDTMLVAPISVGDGAYTAAGSVITDDVPAGAMAVGRAKQRNILGWVLRKRAGSAAAKAALLADSVVTPENDEGQQ